jgi:streptomycin 6-kinase
VRWDLVPEGEPIITRSSRLLPVRCQGAPVMLKITTEPKERQGSALMIWWDGNGAAMTETPCGPRGWLAIDPKGLCGERGFDFVNIFCNPDFALATAPGRLVRQAMSFPR